MLQIDPRKFSFDNSLYRSSMDFRPIQLPKVSYLFPVRSLDETTLGKIFPVLDINKSIAHSLTPKIRSNSPVLSPFVYRQTLFNTLQALESAQRQEFQDVVRVLKEEMEKQKLFVFYQNSLFAA